MNDWVKKLDGFISLNDRNILQNAGTISHELAKENAENEYKKFQQKQQKSIKENDFEKVINKLEKKIRPIQSDNGEKKDTYKSSN